MSEAREDMSAAGLGALSVQAAKARLRQWGVEADAAQHRAIEAARQQAKKAAPYAALGAGLLGLLSAAGMLRRTKRSGREGREGREGQERGAGVGGLEGLVPLLMAGARLAPVVMGMMERMASKGRARRNAEGD